MIAYHDTEWGVPVHDDEKLFEFMVLDAMQAAGLVNDHLTTCFRFEELANSSE